MVIIFPLDEADTAALYFNTGNIAIIKAAAAAVKVSVQVATEVRSHIPFNVPFTNLLLQFCYCMYIITYFFDRLSVQFFNFYLILASMFIILIIAKTKYSNMVFWFKKSMCIEMQCPCMFQQLLFL